jgi:hypothetical protein
VLSFDRFFKPLVLYEVEKRDILHVDFLSNLRSAEGKRTGEYDVSRKSGEIARKQEYFVLSTTV